MCLAWPGAARPADCARPESGAEHECRLEIGRPFERTIARGRSLYFSARLQEDTRYRITVRQQAIDVRLSISGPDETTTGSYDSPFREFAWELALLETESSGAYVIGIEAIDASNLEGRFVLTVEALAKLPADHCSLASARLASRAAAVDADTERGRLASLEMFRKAFEASRPCADVAEQARLMHATAALLERLDRSDESFDAYRRSSELYAAAGHASLSVWMTYFAAARLVDLDEYVRAREIFMALLEQIGDDLRLKSALENYIGVSFYWQADYPQARLWWERTLATLSGRDDPHQEATAVYNLAWLHRNNGEPDASLEYFRRALEIEQKLADEGARADILMSIGEVHAATGDCSEALRFFERARAIFEDAAIERGSARVLRRTGDCYLALGLSPIAESAYRRASRRFTSLNAPREEADVLLRLGEIARDEGRTGDAIALQDAALALHRGIENPRGIVAALLQRARTSLARDDPARAEADVRAARTAAAGIDARELVADLELLSGMVDAQAGRLDAARLRLTRGASLYRAARNSLGEIEALLATAQLEHRSGRIPQCLSAIEEALPIVERSRARIGSPDLRATFFESVQKLYELEADALMTLYAETGDDAWLERAWSASDRARSRALRDVLDRGRDVYLRRVDPDLALQRKKLRRHLTATTLALVRALNDHPTSELVERLQAATHEAQTRFDALEARIQRAYPELEGVRAAEQNIGDLQRTLAPNEALLHFEVGDSRSFVWLIGVDGVRHSVLDGRAALETEIMDVYGELRSRRATDAQLRRLSESIVGVLAGSEGIARLYLVLDGAVDYVPFPALYWPGTDDLLVERAEIVHLAASALKQGRQPATVDMSGARIAVLADPVFSPEQLAADGEAETGLSRTLETVDLSELLPLPHTRREARSIRALAGRKRVFFAGGTDATKDLLMDGTVADFSILHLATHGLVSAGHPELSGLVFSMVDRSGAPVDGFLTLGEIYTLELDTQLVVLSACETGIGPHIRGEGLISLARGFLQVGADAVVASRWQVPDRATAELMEAFYASLLRPGVSAASALRHAQLEVMSHRRWRDPYYWASFAVLRSR